MKKNALIFLSVLMIVCLVGCGSNSDKSNDGNNSSTNINITPAEIEQKIADAIGKDNYLCDTDIDKDWLQNSFGFDLSKIESYAAKQNSVSSVNPDTVIVLKVKDGYAEEAVKLLNTNYSQMVDYIRQYPFGTAKVLNARIYQSGNYVMYILAGASYDGEDSEAESKLAVSEYAKIDEAIKNIFGSLPNNSAVVPENDGSAGGLISSGDNDDMPLLGGN